MQRIVIKGELPSLNKYTDANRRNPYAGAKIKRLATTVCEMATKQAMVDGLKITPPFNIVCHWYTKDNRKDHDNISFGIKFIQDGLISAHLIENDGPKQIHDINHLFKLDKNNPRVEVELIEVGK